MKFRALKKILSEYGIQWDDKIGKGSHGAFVGLTFKTKLRHVFTIPHKHQRDVPPSYVSACRRQFELTVENGVSNDQFC